ncbi:MAG: glutathione S-transferase family protein [Betaproteobacteria bacterium]|nr:glutathione S-transferase family protein [Betaproteobacteria bacterium]
MIDLYTWPTPNGRKVNIMLEETGLPYTVHAVNTQVGDQLQPEFLKINPNGKIPAIVDRNGPGDKPFALFESGAILIYLAEKSGKFLPYEPSAKYTTLQWLMFQMSAVGPMFGQAGHFRNAAKEKSPYAIERFTNEVNRLHKVLNQRLAQSEYLVGERYTIADIATWPWVANPERRGVDMALYPHMQRWYEGILARPAVQRGMALLAEARK